MKYILVTGGVISGVGKGVIASSFGAILKHCGIQVTCIKIDPYINIDAGTFSPYEHGEVYVLDDGGEVDLDLGNYERFLGVTLHQDNNITTGKIYQSVIDRERRGDYLGKTVQMVPHITLAIQEWVERVAKIPVSNEDNKIPEVCIVELGGTIDDIESTPFIEAFREFQIRVSRDNLCVAHVSLVPQPKATGEAKTKPTQSSVRQLQRLGLHPDLIMCRSEYSLSQEVKNKISHSCRVAAKQVVCIHDMSSIYRVPMVMKNQGMVDFLKERLQLDITLPLPRGFMSKWRDLADRIDLLQKPVKIALVGKYVKLEDSYNSLIKALQHASIECGHKLELVFIDAANLERQTKQENPVSYHEAWVNLCKSSGVIVPGGFGMRGIEGMVEAINWARVQRIPYLGICLGFQVAVIEFARNVLNLEFANSTEVDPNTLHPVVIDMPEHNPGNMGGTMRLGKRTTVFTAGKSVIKQMYNKDRIEERHRHRYEVNPKYAHQLEEKGLKFVGHDELNIRKQVLELDEHPYFIATQFHPEYLTRPLTPSPPFLGFILAACGKLQRYLHKDDKLSQQCISVNETSDENKDWNQ